MILGTLAVGTLRADIFTITDTDDPKGVQDFHRMSIRVPSLLSVESYQLMWVCVVYYFRYNLRCELRETIGATLF